MVRVAQVVHVFVEDSTDDQLCHLEEWFGCAPPSGHPRDAACACGARLVQLTRDGRVLGVWHKEMWSPWKEL